MVVIQPALFDLAGLYPSMSCSHAFAVEVHDELPKS